MLTAKGYNMTDSELFSEQITARDKLGKILSKTDIMKIAH